MAKKNETSIGRHFLIRRLESVESVSKLKLTYVRLLKIQLKLRKFTDVSIDSEVVT